MAKKQNRYQALEQRMTEVLIGDAAIFVVCLVASGLGITWLKVITAIIALLGSVLCLAFLYMSQELLRPRSLWMSMGFAAIVLVLVVSLLLRYPSPNGNQETDKSGDLGQIPAFGAVTLFLDE